MNAARRTPGTPAKTLGRRTRRGAAGASRLLAGGLLLAALAACAPRGDFGRPAPSIVSDRILPFAGRLSAEARGEPAAWSLLTDDERELRARAYRFLTPAHEALVLERMLAELIRHRATPAPLRLGGRRSYYAALVFSAQRSPAPLFRRIAQDAEQDRVLIAPLREIADRVLQADAARLRFLLHVRELESGQAEGAAERVAENRCLVAWVRAEARERSRLYRYALERLAVEAPQRDAIGPERALDALDAQIATLVELPVGALDACADPIARPAAAASAPAATGVRAPPEDVIPFKR